MSSPSPNEPCKEGIKREDWDKCVRHGTWRVAIGIILGAIGSAVVVSEMPVVVGTGLGIGWAVRHCKNILRKPDSSMLTSTEDPCACCNSNFEALEKDEFEMDLGPTDQTPPEATPEPREVYEEEKCTCNEIPVTWSPPRPADDPFEHPVGCSCYR